MKQRELVIFISGVVVGLVIAASGLVVLGSYTEQIEPTPSPCDRIKINRDSVRIKVNEARLANGSQQTLDYLDLQEYAQERADEIAETGLVTHDTRFVSFWEWAETKKYDTERWAEVSENIVDKRVTTCDAINAFLGSPTHKDAMIDPENRGIGIGVNGQVIVLILGDLK